MAGQAPVPLRRHRHRIKALEDLRIPGEILYNKVYYRKDMAEGRHICGERTRHTNMCRREPWNGLGWVHFSAVH